MSVDADSLKACYMVVWYYVNSQEHYCTKMWHFTFHKIVNPSSYQIVLSYDKEFS